MVICVKNKENNKNYYCLSFMYQGLINNSSASNSTLNFQSDTNLCLNKNGRNIWCLGNGFGNLILMKYTINIMVTYLVY